MGISELGLRKVVLFRNEMLGGEITYLIFVFSHAEGSLVFEWFGLFRLFFLTIGLAFLGLTDMTLTGISFLGMVLFRFFGDLFSSKFLLNTNFVHLDSNSLTTDHVTRNIPRLRSARLIFENDMPIRKKTLVVLVVH